eukprot:GHVT01008816.1.p1 GENE.GHVT01008816.1~~GHVT01008816.1.p1  ORF type:complete len:158 (+),score=60.35 GHVT01008816.1:125-598(+)
MEYQPENARAGGEGQAMAEGVPPASFTAYPPTQHYDPSRNSRAAAGAPPSSYDARTAPPDTYGRDPLQQQQQQQLNQQQLMQQHMQQLSGQPTQTLSPQMTTQLAAPQAVLQPGAGVEVPHFVAPQYTNYIPPGGSTVTHMPPQVRKYKPKKGCCGC